MKGLVLCGGQSMRMGRDKATLSLNRNWWAQLAATQLAPFTTEVLLSVNSRQAAYYPQLFTHRLIADDNALAVRGPLQGLLSAHLAAPQDDWLVLACDMIYMQAPPLARLVHRFQQQTSSVLVYGTAEKTQPLCGIYTAQALQHLYHLYTQQALTRYSMHHVLEMVQAHIMLLPITWQPYFANMNSPEDITKNTRPPETQR